jgi:hypothetical protein
MPRRLQQIRTLVALVLERHDAADVRRHLQHFHARVGVQLEVADRGLDRIALAQRVLTAGRVDAPAVQRADLRFVIERDAEISLLATGGSEHFHDAATARGNLARSRELQDRFIEQHDCVRVAGRRQLRRNGATDPRRKLPRAERRRREHSHDHRDGEEATDHFPPPAVAETSTSGCSSAVATALKKLRIAS